MGKFKVIRHPEPPAPKSRPIFKFDQPAPAPKPDPHPTVPASNAVARHAVQVASDRERQIDPKMMHY